MNNPDLQKWLLAPDGIATRLRALRGATPGNAFAADAGMRPSKLSKLELAQQTPTAADIQAIVIAAGKPESLIDELVAKLAEIPATTTAARINRLGQVATQKRLNHLLADSMRMQSLELTHLPRPLQTIEYATAALKAAAVAQGVTHEPDAVKILTESGVHFADARRTWQIIIWEPVLLWSPLPASDMRTQLQQILDAAAFPELELRILPLHQAGIMLPPAGFVLTDTDGYTDTLEGATLLAGNRLKGYASLMADLWTAAAAGREAEVLINNALARTRNAAPVRFVPERGV